MTAPLISPFFATCLARQILQILQASNTHTVYEFGAGNGLLACQLLQCPDFGAQVSDYFIVEVSTALRGVQEASIVALPGHLSQKVKWLNALPDTISGVAFGNEVLDAIPVKLLYRPEKQKIWLERGVVTHTQDIFHPQAGLQWQDHPSALTPPREIEEEHAYLTEIHPTAEAFIRSLAERLKRGALLFIDYGFNEREYYHPQRAMGTLVCHRAHQVDNNPLLDIGEKDITAHVNFTGIALAAQNAGLCCLGYTSQAWFLMNCGILDSLQTATLPERAMAQKLVTEHEMGELFKVIALGHEGLPPLWGFAQGDQLHKL